MYILRAKIPHNIAKVTLEERTFMSSFLNLLYIIISIYNIFAPAPVLEW